MGRVKDVLSGMDFLQVLGGSILGSMLVLFGKTVAPPTLVTGFLLGVLMVFAVTLSIIGIRNGFYPKRLFLFLLTAGVVAYPFSSLLGLLVGDVTFQTLFSWDYFTTATFVSFLLGFSTGAMADAVKD